MCIYIYTYIYMQKTRAQLPGMENSLSIHTECFQHKIYFNFIFSFIIRVNTFQTYLYIIWSCGERFLNKIFEKMKGCKVLVMQLIWKQNGKFLIFRYAGLKQGFFICILEKGQIVVKVSFSI